MVKNKELPKQEHVQKKNLKKLLNCIRKEKQMDRGNYGYKTDCRNSNGIALNRHILDTTKKTPQL